MPDRILTKRSFSPGPAAALPVPPTPRTAPSAQPPVVSRTVFWIALHMLSSSCLVMPLCLTIPALVAIRITIQQMILNKLAVFKGADERTNPTLPVFTVMSLQTAFSVAFVWHQRCAITWRMVIQWMPVRPPAVEPVPLLTSHVVTCHRWPLCSSPCSAPGSTRRASYDLSRLPSHATPAPSRSPCSPSPSLSSSCFETSSPFSWPRSSSFFRCLLCPTAQRAGSVSLVVWHELRCRDRVSALADSAVFWPCCRSALQRPPVYDFPARNPGAGCCSLRCW